MYDTALPTMDEATVRTTPQTVRETGVSSASLKPKAQSHKQIRRKAFSRQYYSIVGSLPKPVHARRAGLALALARITSLLMQGQIQSNPTTLSLPRNSVLRF
jgi:hypothetical protein